MGGFLSHPQPEVPDRETTSRSNSERDIFDYYSKLDHLEGQHVFTACDTIEGFQVHQPLCSLANVTLPNDTLAIINNSNED
ncbi:hypothetical protein P9112_004672 [Eukaryota sp. TZLM1-RC]